MVNTRRLKKRQKIGPDPLTQKIDVFRRFTKFLGVGSGSMTFLDLLGSICFFSEWDLQKALKLPRHVFLRRILVRRLAWVFRPLDLNVFVGRLWTPEILERVLFEILTYRILVRLHQDIFSEFEPPETLAAHFSELLTDWDTSDMVFGILPFCSKVCRIWDLPQQALQQEGCGPSCLRK